MNKDKRSLLKKKKRMKFKQKNWRKKIPWTTMDYTVRKPQEIKQNKTKNNRKSRGQFHQSDQLVWQKADCSKYPAQLNQCQGKNVSASTSRRRFCKAGLYDSIAEKKTLLRNQNNIKRLQWVMAHNDWTLEQLNKILWTEESKFEIWVKLEGLCVAKSWWKSFNHCIPPTIKPGGGSIMMRGAFANCCQRFAPGEGQIESDQLSQHTAASHDPVWNTGCGSRICIRVR